MATPVAHSTQGSFSDQPLGVQEGYSLVEVLAALVVLGLITTSLLVIRNNSIQEARLARNTRIAWQLAQQKYSEIKQINEQTRIPASGTFELHDGYNWETNVQKVNLQMPTTRNQFSNSNLNKEQLNLYQIDLTISYPGSQPDQRKTIRLRLLRSFNNSTD